MQIAGNIHYLLNSGLGFGAKFRYLTTDASRTDLLFEAGEHYGVISVAEQNEIIFLPPSLIYARWPKYDSTPLNTIKDKT